MKRLFVKLLRLIFLSDLKINLAYPIRMGLFYWVSALSFLAVTYYVVSTRLHDRALAETLLKELFTYQIFLGALFFVITFTYTLVASSDYGKVQRFARKLSKGEFEKPPSLSPLADKDLQEITDALVRVRRSFIITKELLNKRRSKSA